MDNNETTDGDKTTSSEVKATDSKSQRSPPTEDAGPSRVNNLPGAVFHAKLMPAKPGISKSEHSMRHIITSKDVTEALKSLSFGTPAQAIKNLNLKELKIPILDSEANSMDDSTTLIDLKKFMASCFKLVKDTPNAIVLGEIPTVKSVHPVIIPITPDTTTRDAVETRPGHSSVQTESTPIPINTNEVIVTKMIEAKISKTDKKKTGSISEKSELGVAARDSLSSIGSNVCRICMTRGRERLVQGKLRYIYFERYSLWYNIRCLLNVLPRDTVSFLFGS